MKEESIEGAKTPNPTDNAEEKSEQPQSEVDKLEEDKLEEESVEELEEEQSEAEKLAIELSQAKDKYLRLYSEFENFRRRTAKERLEMIGSASAELMTDLLPILDDFERARGAAENIESNVELEGMNLIYQKLSKLLKSKGLEPMEKLEGKSFDAEVHEAISQIPAPKKKLKNRIIHVVEKGYYLNLKVIRYAKVVIGT